MLKQRFFSFIVLIALLLSAACTSNRENIEQPLESSRLEENDEAAEGSESATTELSQAAAATTTVTATIEPTETSTSTPLPPTAAATITPTPTNTPIPTPTPKPLTPANFGWEGTDTDTRPSFPDEERIKDEILSWYEESQDVTVAREDIKNAWYTAEDGTIYWRPYFTSQMGKDFFLFTFEPREDEQGVVSLRWGWRVLNLSSLERLGIISNLTDVQLLWSERNNKPLTAVEKNGSRLWYADEFAGVLLSYDEDLSAFNLPAKPEPASDYVVVLNSYGDNEFYLFPYDENAELTAGIARHHEGPTHKLVNNQWQEINGADSMTAVPRIAYVGYDESENGYLYVDEVFSNSRSTPPMFLRNNIGTAKAVAPAPYYFAQGTPAVPATPSWSPDGRLIAFITEVEGQHFLAVYDTDTGEILTLRRIAANAAIAELITWSPDGNWILYKLVSPSDLNGGIWSTSYPDGQAYYIGQGCHAKWMEENNETMIIYNPHCYVNQYEITYPDGSETGLTINAPDETTHPYDDLFGYLPDKHAILFSRSNLENGTFDLFLLPIDEDEEIHLASIPNPENKNFYLGDYAFSPDDKWLIWRNTDGSGTSVLNLETQEFRVEPDWHHFTGWAPDSKGFGQGMQIVDIETGEIQALFTLPPEVHNVIAFRWDTGFDLDWVERANN